MSQVAAKSRPVEEAATRRRLGFMREPGKRLGKRAHKNRVLPELPF